MLPLTGKGVWLQRITACENGDLNAIVARARAAGLAHVLVKIADGADAANLAADGGDLARELTARLSAAGVTVWGWQSLYGDRPAFKGAWIEDYHLREAEAARERVRALRDAGLRGLALETRSAYEHLAGRAHKAAEYMDALRRALPDLPLALSSWKSPAAHPAFPWAEFRQACDLDLPQVFWLGRHGEAARQLEAAARQFRRLTPARPLAAAAPGFFEANWRPAPGDLAEFVQRALALDLVAVSVWAWDHFGLRGDEPHNAQRLDFRPHWQAWADTVWAGISSAVETAREATTDSRPQTQDEATAGGGPPPQAVQTRREEPLIEEFDLTSEDEAAADRGQLSVVVPSPPEEHAVEEFDLTTVDEETAGSGSPTAVMPASREEHGAEAPAFAVAEAAVGQPASAVEQAQPEVNAAPARTVFMSPPEGASPTAALRPELTAFFKALRTGRGGGIGEFYAAAFAHVTDARVAHERPAVAEFYQAAWARWRPASLAVRAAENAGPAWRVAWTVQDQAGEWADLLDEFHFNRAGKIVYHHTRLTP